MGSLGGLGGDGYVEIKTEEDYKRQVGVNKSIAAAADAPAFTLHTPIHTHTNATFHPKLLAARASLAKDALEDRRGCRV